MRSAQRSRSCIPGRVDVIGGGALVLDTVMQRIGIDSVVASEHDILDGIAFSAAAGPAAGEVAEASG